MGTRRARGAPVEASLPGLLELVYDAALDVTRWPVLLDAVREELGGGLVSLAHWTPHGVTWRAVGIDPEARGRYERYFSSLDPWGARGVALLEAGRSISVLPGAELAPRDELLRSEFYADWLRPQGLLDGLGALLETRHDGIIALSAVRPVAAEPLSEGHVALFRKLQPHLQRALRVNTLSAGTPDPLTYAALDALSVGVVVIGSRGAVVWMNRAMSGLLATSTPGLLVSGRGLSAGTRSATDRLAAEIGRCVNGKDAGATVVLPRGEGNAPWVAAVVPLRSPVAEVQGLDPGQAVLFVRDTETAPAPSARLLRELYGLTPAEARLALKTATGMAPREAAEALGIAWNTARAQLVRVFAKTGTHGQARLVRLLAALGSVTVER